MHIFNGTVRLQGAIGNEIVKYGLTVPEIVVFRQIHGNDGVVNLQHVGEAEVDDIDERERLSTLYDEGLSNLGDELKTSIAKIFGGDYNELPQELRGFKGPLSDEEGFLEDFQEPPIVVQEDVGITPMEKARQRRAEAGKRAVEKAAAVAASKNKTKGKAGLDAAL